MRRLLESGVYFTFLFPNTARKFGEVFYERAFCRHYIMVVVV